MAKSNTVAANKAKEECWQKITGCVNCVCKVNVYFTTQCLPFISNLTAALCRALKLHT